MLKMTKVMIPKEGYVYFPEEKPELMRGEKSKEKLAGRQCPAFRSGKNSYPFFTFIAVSRSVVYWFQCSMDISTDSIQFFLVIPVV
ncbi:MAG TPA: hypothetical protein DCZ40_11750, partial [Lachnospiraceae bacterium]|nr:hypothetical protein [Lachnospiraceae bacterium]